MSNRINIAEILKVTPIGTRLYSPLCGNCTLEDVSISEDYPISVRVDDIKYFIGFSQFGEYDKSFPSAECLLFPSKDNRDWSTFKAMQKHKHFEPLQKVLFSYSNHYGQKEWGLGIYSHWSSLHKCHVLLNGEEIAGDYGIIPYKGNEDKLGKIAD